MGELQTAMSSNIIGTSNDFFANLAVDAVTSVRHNCDATHALSLDLCAYLLTMEARTALRFVWLFVNNGCLRGPSSPTYMSFAECVYVRRMYACVRVCVCVHAVYSGYVCMWAYVRMFALHL